MGHIGRLPALTELFEQKRFNCQFQIRSIFSKTMALFQHILFFLQNGISLFISHKASNEYKGLISLDAHSQKVEFQGLQGVSKRDESFQIFEAFFK